MLDRIADRFGDNEPIFFSDIADISGLSRPRVNQLIKEWIDNGKLARFSEGVFYIPTQTLLGTSTLNVSKVIEKKYIQKEGECFGVYTGLMLLNSFGQTTQMPNVYEIVTNNEATRKREVTVGYMKVRLKKSRCEITTENKDVYMLLELFNQIDTKSEMDTTRILKFVKENNIKYADIVKYMEYFPAKTSKNLYRSEIIYATL